MASISGEHCPKEASVFWSVVCFSCACHSKITNNLLVTTFTRNGQLGEKPELGAKPRYLVYFHVQTPVIPLKLSAGMYHTKMCQIIYIGKWLPRNNDSNYFHSLFIFFGLSTSGAWK